MNRFVWLLVLLPALSASAGDGAIGDVGNVGKNINRTVEDATKSFKKEGANVQQKLDEAAAAQKECEALATQPVSLEDELALGGAVAVKLAESKGLLIDLGPVSAAAVKKGTPIPKDSPVNELVRYVNRVGRVMAAHSARSQLEWKFGVLKDEQVNAWSAPGGFVFVTTGLLRKLKWEDELAGVLAHEISHVSRRHALTHYTAYKRTECNALLQLSANAGAHVVKGASSLSKQLGPLFQRFNVNLSVPQNVDVLKIFTELIVDGILDKGPGAEAELQADRDAADMMISARYWVKAYRQFVEGLSAGGSHPAGSARGRALTQYVTVGRQVDDFTPPPSVTEGKKIGDELKALSSIK